MTTQSEAPQGGPSNAPTATDAPGISPADMQSAVEAARTDARAEGITAGKAEATARIQAILTAPEAEGRDAQALVLALETEMTAADAAKVLAASPKAEPGDDCRPGRPRDRAWAQKRRPINAIGPSAMWPGGRKPSPRPMRASAE